MKVKFPIVCSYYVTYAELPNSEIWSLFNNTKIPELRNSGM